MGSRSRTADGRAGMAAIVMQPGAAFDGRAMAQQLGQALPAYAVPLFVRIVKTQETTGTFKLRKVELKQQGFDPAAISEPLFVLLDRDKGYEALDGWNPPPDSGWQGEAVTRAGQSLYDPSSV